MYGYVRGIYFKNYFMIYFLGNFCFLMYKYYCMNVLFDKCYIYCLILWYFIEIEDRMK